MRRGFRRLVFVSILVVASVMILLVSHLIAFRVPALAYRVDPSPFTFPFRGVDGRGRGDGSSDTVQQAFHAREKLQQTKEAEVSNASDTYVAPLRNSQGNGSALEVTIPISGQLGNQMFQYASLLGIAEMNGGRKAYYGTASKIGRIFQATRLADHPHRSFKVVFEKDFAGYDPKFQSLPQENVVLMQYLQSWKYFDFIRSTIQREFTFKPIVSEPAANLLKKHALRIGNKTKIGVHVRRGDFLVAHHIRKGYHTAPASYVRKAMDYMRQSHGDVIFIFVTDDPSWCRKEFQTTDHVITDMAPAEVHLAVLASCDHVIMTVGTYGWWGAYLAGGDVVYYWDREQCLHDPPMPVEIKRPQDFFLPSWVSLTG